MTDKERLLQISTKQLFETGGNTIKADDINFMFRYIETLEYENEKLKQRNKRISDTHIQVKEQLENRIGELEKVLEFYENEEYYFRSEYSMITNQLLRKIEGMKARQALEGDK
ncbi:hypothetical protein [Terrihalobacillus insolitus]|uniref:hypothetical protein n=1 Tax=Terrihalobacillus insolitus TaxID=2950438 RepID=UPI0023413577|nr:hypothetical protein [Terrihalobacillus insolitus]MDC3414286.1 hypothetical protein [Terrihalobacillus insolitus]